MSEGSESPNVAEDVATLPPITPSRVKPVPGCPGLFTAPADPEMAGGEGREDTFSLATYPFVGIQDTGETCSVIAPGMAHYLGVTAAEVRQALASYLREKSSSGDQLETYKTNGLEDL